ncbi:hypothetical protein AB2B41_14980 [Marimonas sp. MJW-29]|uniref:Uncharacterized protein n=1 Tax=Sulfitobacter sediminis TaxID=3234186 RepID=A0ABV3RPK5_9RHOB
MTDENIVRIMNGPRYKGPWKGPGHNKDVESRMIDDFADLITEMKQMLDKDLTRKA